MKNILLKNLIIVSLLVGSLALAQDLQLINHGAWVSDSTGPGQMWDEDISVWVDIQVPNWSYDKVVGVVWTADKWETHDVAFAHYEYSFWDGYEKWGVDIIPAGILGNSYIGPGSWNGKSLLGPGPQTAEVNYAIFYILPDGTTVWDNNEGWNYQIMIAWRS